MSDNSRIRVFATGGTFDKEYDELTGQLLFQRTHLADMLRLGRCHLDVAIESLMMVDSLEMSDRDRELIAMRCQEAEEDRIVITHGTDTMERTAAVLGPGSGTRRSSCYRRYGAITRSAARMACSIWEPAGFRANAATRVYVAMNGRCFRGTRCERTGSWASSSR